MVEFNRNDGLDQVWELSNVGDWNNKTENSSVTNYGHNAVHELTSIGNSGINYDANGNPLVGSNGDVYTWDLDNRLDSTTDMSFQYDALGRRVAITQGYETTNLVCAGNQLIAMYDADNPNSSPQRTFVYGTYIDEPLLMKADSTKTYYHRNQQYSITALTDDTGIVIERYVYDAHGNTTILSPEGTLRTESEPGNPFAYTGRYHHPALNLYFFRARYYDATAGRFIARDPLEYVDGMSPIEGILRLVRWIQLV